MLLSTPLTDYQSLNVVKPVMPFAASPSSSPGKAATHGVAAIYIAKTMRGSADAAVLSAQELDC
jgi:hypothetical protein